MEATRDTIHAEATETEKPIATGKTAFAAARTELRAQSKDQGAGQSADDTPEQTPAQETEAPADEPTETDEEVDTLLPAEEVAKLSAGDRKLYEKAQKNYTQKTQRLAAERKEFEPYKQLIDGLRDNPADAIAQLAQKHGVALVPKAATQDSTVETKTAETLAELPEEWAFLKPVFDGYGKKLLATLRGEIEPVKQHHVEQMAKAVEAETKSTVEAFTAKYPEWQKQEAKMLQIGQKFLPAPGSMTDFEYMETLFKLATSDITEAERTKKVIERINKSAEKSEAAPSGADSSRVEQVMPSGLQESTTRFRAAAKAAKRGERWTVTQ